MNYIEELLFEKTKDFNEGHVYADQWKIAKSYLPQVLDTISHIFPHYSLHNSTHSEAIINNIIRILGTDSINKLSVVDLWLILAAAYYHDCGMAVSGSDKEKMFEGGSDFVKFVEDKQHDLLSPMNQYAVLFNIKDNKIYYKDVAYFDKKTNSFEVTGYQPKEMIDKALFENCPYSPDTFLKSSTPLNAEVEEVIQTKKSSSNKQKNKK